MNTILCQESNSVLGTRNEENVVPAPKELPHSGEDEQIATACPQPPSFLARELLSYVATHLDYISPAPLGFGEAL